MAIHALLPRERDTTCKGDAVNFHPAVTGAWTCVQGLADSAPEEAIPALRGPLTEALKDVQQDQDRPRTFAAAEVLSGLLASSSSYSGEQPSRDASIPARSLSAKCII